MDKIELSLLDMKSYFEERMTKFEGDLRKQSSSDTGHLAEDFSAFKSFMMTTLQTFSEQLQTLAREVDNLEMRSRRKMLLLHGVDEMKDEDPAQLVTEVIQQRLKLDGFTPGDIRRCHRMGRQGPAHKPRPLLVKFTSSTLRDSLWFSKTKLKGSGITMSEFLTRARHKAFMAAREKFGVNKCWTREGCVYVLGPDGNRHKITSLGDLGRIKGVDTEKPQTKTAPKTRRAAAASKKQ